MLTNIKSKINPKHNHKTRGLTRMCNNSRKSPSSNQIKQLNLLFTQKVILTNNIEIRLSLTRQLNNYHKMFKKDKSKASIKPLKFKQKKPKLNHLYQEIKLSKGKVEEVKKVKRLIQVTIRLSLLKLEALVHTRRI